MFVASLTKFKIYIDGVMVGKIKNGQSLTVDVTPGQHEISVHKKNPTMVTIEKDTTADVVIYGANSFGITNINGGSGNPTLDDNDAIAKCEQRANLLLIGSVALPIISVIMFYATSQKYVLQFWFYSVVIGYALVNISGLKNIKDHDSSTYKALLLKNVISLVIGIISVIITIYITNFGL